MLTARSLGRKKSDKENSISKAVHLSMYQISLDICCMTKKPNQARVEWEWFEATGESFSIFVAI